MSEPSLYGLILAGGQSQRMGQSKARLPYGGIAQYRRAAGMLFNCCKTVFLSCRPEHKAAYRDIPLILDWSEFGEIGPLNGVLSAFGTLPGPWLVLGCDYPLISAADLELLLRARDPQAPATVFIHPESNLPEPLIGIYEQSAATLLAEWLRNGGQSLRVFLEENKAKMVPHDNPQHLKSVDTPEAYAQIVQQWKQEA